MTTPFLEQFRQTPSGNPSNDLVNLDRQGFPNLWFSHAGKYDQQKHGTYGTKGTVDLLTQLNDAKLGFQPQISAGYANIGHSDGKGGEHKKPGVFDVGLSGRTPAQAQQLKQFFESRGIPVLEEGRGTSNWHLHVRGGGGHHAPNPNPKMTPFLEQFRQQPTAQPNQVSSIDKLANRTITRLQQPRPQPAFQDPSFTEGLSNVANAGLDLLKQIPGAVRKEVDSLVKDPVAYPFAVAGAALTGALSAPTDVINMVTQTPAAIGNAYLGRREFKPLLPEVYGVRDIPGLHELTEQHPVADFAGGAVDIFPVLGALSKGKNLGNIGKAAGIAETPGLSRLDAADVMPPGYTGPQYGFVNRNGEVLGRFANEAPPVELTPNPDTLNTPATVKELNQGFINRVREANGLTEIFDPRKAAIPEEFGPVKAEGTASGLQIITKAGAKEDAPQIDIVRDPFYRTEPAEPVAPTPDLSKPAETTRTPLSQVIDEGLSGDNVNRDSLLAFDTLETLGYDVHDITKKNNTASLGKQYSVKIGGKTVRFEDGQTLGGLMSDHQISSSTVAKGVNMRGGKFNQERLLEMLPDSPAKQRFLSEQGAADIAARDAAEAAHFVKSEADANELMARIEQAENMDHLGELFQEAMDPKYQDSPASETIFNALESAERRLAGDPSAPVRSTRDIGLRRADEITGQSSTDILGGKPAKSNVVQMPARGRVDLLDAQGRPLRGEKPAPVDLLKPKPANPAELEIPRPFTREPAPAPTASKPVDMLAPAEKPAGRYSPEIQRQLDEVDAAYNRQLQQLKEGKSISGSVYLDRQIKGLGMERAAKKRQIIQGDSLERVEGGLTDYELGVLQKREATNYAGKAVTVDNQPAKVVNTSFGKVKVQFEDGSTRMVEPSAIQPRSKYMLAPAEKPVAKPEASKPAGGIYRTPEGGEVYTHGRDTAAIQQQLQGVQGQIANIAEIERHLQTHNPEAVPAIRNILNAGKNSEAAKFSYIAREAPGEAPRVRDNFVPTHFTFESIKPATQRSYLRKRYGSDEEVIAHLKQEILDRGGSIDAATLQTKGGAEIKAANQVTKLINALDDVTGGAYLKSPRVHGINLGETTRSASGGRGIRLDTIVDSSLTGRKVTPELLAGHAYDNKISATFKALDQLAQNSSSPVFSRAIKQIQKGGASRNTMRELKKALADKKLGVQFCNIFGVVHD